MRKLKTFQSTQTAKRIFPFNNRPLSSCQPLHARQQFYVSIAYPNLLKCNGEGPSLDIIVALRAVLLRSAPFRVRRVSVSLLDHVTSQSHTLSTDVGSTHSIGHNWWFPFFSKINRHRLCSWFPVSWLRILCFCSVLDEDTAAFLSNIPVYLSLHPPQFITHN